MLTKQLNIGKGFMDIISNFNSLEHESIESSPPLENLEELNGRIVLVWGLLNSVHSL